MFQIWDTLTTTSVNADGYQTRLPMQCLTVPLRMRLNAELTTLTREQAWTLRECLLNLGALRCSELHNRT